MSKILRPPKGKVDNVSFLIEQWEEMVRKQDGRTGRQALTDDTKRAIMMKLCPPELERHLVLNSDRYDAHPKQSQGRHQTTSNKHATNPARCTPGKWNQKEAMSTMANGKYKP